jgi:chaperonin GroEL
MAVLERTLGPTIGPAARPVAVAPIGRPGQPPELLDDGATIARRMTGIPDRFENMGFMLARQAAWRMRTTAGDGAATAVVIATAAHRALLRHAAAGASRRDLATGAACAVERACATIEALATPLRRDETGPFTAMVAGSPDVATAVVEAIDLLGLDTPIITRASAGSRIHLECIEGALWESTAVLAPLASDLGSGHLRLDRPAILLWDAPLDDVAGLPALMAMLRTRGKASCVVIARTFAPPVLGLIRRNAAFPCRIVPFMAPHAGQQQEEAYADLAALTGARRLLPAGGDALSRATDADLGTAQRVTIGPRFLNLMATRDRQPGIDRHLAHVRHLLERCEDDSAWRRLHARLGRLRQGMGVLWIGAPTPVERDHLLQRSDHALACLRAARAGGVVPGAGATLLAAARQLTSNFGSDPGALAVAAALEAPARWIARNAGLDPGAAIARCRGLAPGRGLDATTGAIVDLRAAGILDPVATVTTAVRVGLSMAIEAAGCDVLIRRPVRLSQAEIRP